MGILDDAIREHLDLKRRRGADPADVERLEREALGPVRRGGYDPDEAVRDPDWAQGAVYQQEAEEEWIEPAEDRLPFEEAPEYERPARSGYEPPPEAEQRYEPAGEAPQHYEPAPEAPQHHEPADEPPPRADRPPDHPRHHEIAEAWNAHEAVHGSLSEPLRADEPLAPEEQFHDKQPGLAPDAHVPPTPPAAAAEQLPGEGEHGFVPDRADELGEETAEFDVEAAQEDEADAEDVLEETPDFLQDTPDHDRLWFEQRPPRDFDFDG